MISSMTLERRKDCCQHYGSGFCLCRRDKPPSHAFMNKLSAKDRTQDNPLIVHGLMCLALTTEQQQQCDSYQKKTPTPS